MLPNKPYNIIIVSINQYIPPKHSHKIMKKECRKIVLEISFYTIKIKRRVLGCSNLLLCIRTDKNAGEKISKPSTRVLLTPLKRR